MAPWQTASYITGCNSTAFFGNLTFDQAKIPFLKTSKVIGLIKYTYHENIIVSRFLDVMQQLENPTLLLFGEKRRFNVFDNSVHLIFQFGSVQSLSHVRLFATPWTAACQASLSITNSQSLLKLMSIESVMPSSHLILCCPLLLLPLIFLRIRVFSDVSVLLIRWPKYWSFSFSISPSNEYSGLISFRMDWLDLLIFRIILIKLTDI